MPRVNSRELKHRLFVARKRTLRELKRIKFVAATRAFSNVERVVPWRYRPARYAGTFLSDDLDPRATSEFPRSVFVVWTGDNPMTPNRVANLDVIRRELGVQVSLVTPDRVQDWLVPGAPLHPAYEHLSTVHRSDYLRGYLMHHHGGGYCDLKRPVGSWADAFERMAQDPECWVTSFHTTDANWIGKVRGRMGRDILIRHRLMFGKSSFMMRSHTPLTAEWMAEVHRRLDVLTDDLQAHPATDPFWGPGYPVSWTDLLSRVLDPLTLKYHQHVRYDDDLLLDFTNYR